MFRPKRGSEKSPYLCSGPIVQGIEREPPELKIQVRVLVGLREGYPSCGEI
jgi:hypothetical protein